MAKLAVSKTDVQAFANACTFALSFVYDDYRSLFEPHFAQADASTDILTTVAPYLAGDLNRVLVEYLIISVCRFD